MLYFCPKGNEIKNSSYFNTRHYTHAEMNGLESVDCFEDI